MEDDLLLEEQIKKKKRMVLLLLLALLLVTATVAMLLEPAPLPSTAVARVETPTSAEPPIPVATSTPSEFQGDEWTQPTTPVPEDNRTTPSIAVARVETPTSTEPPTPVATSTPSEFQGDEWTLPTTPVPKDNRTTPSAATSTATNTANPVTIAATRQTSTPTVTQIVNQRGTAASLAATSDNGEDLEASSTRTVSLEEGTLVAGARPTTNSGTFVTTPSGESSVEVEGSGIGASTTEVGPAATEISKRINESWDVLDKYDSISGNEVSVSETVTITQSLSSTATVSETVAALPPDGLPITGIIPPGRMNWAAVAMVILLTGTGIIALLYPKRLDT